MKNTLQNIIIRTIRPFRSGNLVRRPSCPGSRNLLGAVVEGVAEGLVEVREDVATGHEDLGAFDQNWMVGDVLLAAYHLECR